MLNLTKLPGQYLQTLVLGIGYSSPLQLPPHTLTHNPHSETTGFAACNRQHVSRLITVYGALHNKINIVTSVHQSTCKPVDPSAW